MDCSDGSDEGVGCPQLEQKKENYVSFDLTTTEVFRLDIEDMIDEPILTTALILTCLVALSSLLLKCKRDRRRGRRGVWVTPRIFGPDGHDQNDRVELNQPCTFDCWKTCFTLRWDAALNSFGQKQVGRNLCKWQRGQPASEIFSPKSLFQTGICQQMPVNFSSSVNCCKYFIKVSQDNLMIKKRKEINNFSCHHPVSRGDGPQPYKESQTEFGEKKRDGEFHSWFVIILFLLCEKWPLDFEAHKEPKNWHWT